MNIDRRSFLQFTGAASAATTLPALLVSKSAQAAGTLIFLSNRVCFLTGVGMQTRPECI